MPAARRTTPYVILGLLRIAPMSGYEIRQELVRATATFWSESYGQIYPALREVASKRWAERRSAAARGGRRRHEYAITRRGRDALDRWLREPPRTAPPRNELLLKLYLADREFLDPPESWIRALLTDEGERLRRLRRLQDQLPRGEHHHPNLRFWLIALEHVERQSEATVAWCQKTLATVSLLQQAQTRRRAAAHRRLPPE